MHEFEVLPPPSIAMWYREIAILCKQGCCEGFLSSVIGQDWDKCEGNLCWAGSDWWRRGKWLVCSISSRVSLVQGETDYFSIYEQLCGTMNHFILLSCRESRPSTIRLWCLRGSGCFHDRRVGSASAVSQITRSRGSRRPADTISDTKPENWIEGRFYSPDKTLPE